MSAVIRMRRRAIAAILPALFLVLAGLSEAKEWDPDRGEYRTDAQLEDLVGPVREVVLETATLRSRSLFDPGGNLVRAELFAYDSNTCSERSYTYDSRGFPLTETYRLGRLSSARTCEALTLSHAKTYRYTFDARGAPTAATITLQNTGSPTPPPSNASLTYVYDAAGRALRRNYTWGGSDRISDAYTYAASGQDLVITRHHTSSFSNGQLTYDLRREITFAPDGRLLEVRQTPDDVFGFGGNERRTYSPAGHLVRVEAGNRVTTYGGHDARGNWTESIDHRGMKRTRQISY